MATNPMPVMTAQQIAAAADDNRAQIEYSPENPQTVDAQQQLAEHDVSDFDKEMLVQIITTYRTGWNADRLPRMWKWMKNVYFDKGTQNLGWDSSNNSWFDVDTWFKTQGASQGGADTYVERYPNNITLMFDDAFVGTMSRGLPPTVIQPENAEVLADVTTAKAAKEAISIIERMNNIRKMVPLENKYLYLFGMYAKYTRIALDGPKAGWDEQPKLGTVKIQKPDRFVCPKCSQETPAQQSNPDQPICARCNAPVGPGDFYGAEEQEFDGVVGTDRVPRAMVKWSIHPPLEFDADPKANDICDTPIAVISREIDIGTARKTFPKLIAKIEEGAPDKTTASGEYERLQRLEMFSFGTGYSADSLNASPTYSMVWMQPDSYYRIQSDDKDAQGMTFADRMTQKFPDGCMVSLIGPEVANIRPAIMEKELSVCLLREGYGLFPPSIADNVVPFNERFNDTMDIIDDWVQRCATGMIIADSSKLDKRQMVNKVMGAGVFNFVHMNGVNPETPLGNAIVQLKFTIDQFMTTYPSMIMNYCQLISGMVPQTFGAGTQEGVETAKGQAQQLETAQSRMNPFWEKLKQEHAVSAQNAIEALQKAMAAGLIKELWEVIQANGSEFRNNYVNLEKMNGRIRVYPDTDQGLPQSPEQSREIWRFLITEVGRGNPVAQAIFDNTTNRELAMSSTLPPEAVDPDAAQQKKTLQNINTLLEKPWTALPGPNGTMIQQLPVSPMKTENFIVAKKTLVLWTQENCDVEKTNPEGWARLMAFYDLMEQAEVSIAVEDAQRKAKVNQAAAPPQPQPDPTIQAAKQELLKKAVENIDQLDKLAHLPPLGKNGSISGQVSAGKEIVDTAMKAATAE